MGLKLFVRSKEYLKSKLLSSINVFQGGSSMMRRKNLVIFGSLLLFFFSTIAAKTIQLSWKNRGNYYEGIREQKKKAHLELISAAICYQEELNNKALPSPDNVEIQFYLPNDDTVFISVREFHHHNYWMQPNEKQWKSGWNVFSWSKNEVLNHLRPVPQLQDLGTVALIGGEYSDTLAPIVLYQRQPPSQITAYRFIFRPSDTEDLLEFEWICHKRGENPTVGEWNSEPGSKPAGDPFSFIWNCVNQEEGWYQLSIRGRLINPINVQEMTDTYQLYHPPNIQQQ